MISVQLMTLNQRFSVCFSTPVLRVVPRGAENSSSDGPESVGGSCDKRQPWMVFMHVSCDVLLTSVWSSNSVQRSHNHIVFLCWVSFITDVDSCVMPTQETDDGKVTGASAS